MAQVQPDFTEAFTRKNQYELHYGQQKGVHYPAWAGAEGDQAALTRSSYPSAAAMSYFAGPTYNQQYRNLVTTALQGRGRTIYDRVQLTGMNDYSTYGRDEKEYEPVSMGLSGITNTDFMIAMGILSVAAGFIYFSR